LPSLAAAPVARQKHGGVNHRRRQSPWLFVGLFGGVVVVVLLLLLVVWALSNPDDPPVAGGETGQGGDPAGTQDPAQGGSTGGSIGQVGPAIVVNAIETPSWTTHGDRQWQYGSHGDVITAGVGVELKSWLTSNERYRDFELTAEFLVSEGGAGGVYVWMPTDVQFPWNQAFEIHFRDDFGALTGDESTGAIWQKAIPSSNRSRPMGTWNTTRITCRHGRIRVSINGEEVIDYSIPHNFRAEGHIGLDGVQGGISYRNIRVKRLPQR
jgi:hypothetical protein